MQRWKVFLAHAAATQESRPPETRTIALGASGPGTERLVIEELQCGSYPQIGKTKRDWGNGPTVPHRHSGSHAEFLCALEQSGALRIPPLHVRGAPRLDLGTRVVLLPLLEELLLVLLPVLSLLGLPGFPLLGREVRELLPLPRLLPLALLVDLRQALANRVLVKLGDLVANLFHQAHDTLRCYAACAAKRELQNRRTLKYKNNYSSANFENQLGGLGPDLLVGVSDIGGLLRGHDGFAQPTDVRVFQLHREPFTEPEASPQRCHRERHPVQPQRLPRPDGFNGTDVRDRAPVVGETAHVPVERIQQGIDARVRGSHHLNDASTKAECPLEERLGLMEVEHRDRFQTSQRPLKRLRLVGRSEHEYVVVLRFAPHEPVADRAARDDHLPDMAQASVELSEHLVHHTASKRAAHSASNRSPYAALAAALEVSHAVSYSAAVSASFAVPYARALAASYAAAHATYHTASLAASVAASLAVSQAA